MRHVSYAMVVVALLLLVGCSSVQTPSNPQPVNPRADLEVIEVYDAGPIR